MKLFALGDPHLAFTVSKPMDIFGDHWKNHPARIASRWRERVGAKDTVLVVGDISWATKLDQALPDLEFLAALPGTKILTKGNHDHWWGSTSRVNRALPPGMTAVLNDAVLAGDVVVAAARGWNFPESPDFDPERDPRIYERELGRLRQALDAASRRVSPGRNLVVMIHYPPLLAPEPDRIVRSAFATMIEESGARICVHGHVHGASLAMVREGPIGPVTYHCVSADHVDFEPRLILET